MFPKLVIHPSAWQVLQDLQESGYVAYRLTSDFDTSDLAEIKAFSAEMRVVVGDLSVYPKTAQKLLKVLESARCGVVCVASRDEGMDATFLSRFAVVEKQSTVANNQTPASLSMSDLLENDTVDFRQLVAKSPALTPIAVSYAASHLPAKRKLFQ